MAHIEGTFDENEQRLDGEESSAQKGDPPATENDVGQERMADGAGEECDEQCQNSSVAGKWRKTKAAKDQL